VGLLRYGLALTVVMFHCGGWSMLSGRSAVFFFYLLSGYLMALVLDRSYGRTAAGALRFWANRALRILPPYFFWVVVSAALLYARGRVGFDIDSPAEANQHFVIDPRILDLDWLADGARRLRAELMLALEILPERLMLTGGSAVLPQAWSLGVEAWFYLFAPFLSLLWARARWLFALFAAASIALNLHILRKHGLEGFDNEIYKNFLTSLFVFQAGMAIYGLRPPGARPWPRAAAIALVLFAAYVAIAGGGGPSLHYALAFYAVLPLGFAIVLVLARAVPFRGGLSWIDRTFGDLAYGVFLSHFAAAFLLLAAQERIFTETGMFNFFGRYNRPAFGAWTCVAATVLAAGSHLLVESPIERLRDRVRTRERPASRRRPEQPLFAPSGRTIEHRTRERSPSS
jgi:peptidoglycan/LPS O-acetylase OafA/YrhL